MILENQKILFVGEDDSFGRVLTSKAISLGCKSISFAIFDDGWDHFNQQSARLIIMEVPQRSAQAFDLCKKMKESPIGKFIAVLLVGAKADHSEHLKAVEAGATCYVAGPLDEYFFEVWLSVTVKNMEDFAGLEKNNSQLEKYKLEMEEVNDQLEDAINRANQMAMEAEQAYVEINQIFKTVAGGIVLIDMDGNIMRHNESFLEIINSSLDDVTSCKCSEVLHPSLCSSTKEVMERIKAGEERVESLVSLNVDQNDGPVVHYSIITTAFHGLVGEVLGVVEHITDITQRVVAQEALKESERRYRQLSTVDELTGLFNKRHFNKSLRNEIDRVQRNGQPLTLIIMDIDNFKHHNDTYGHADGDKVLAKLGEVIRNAIRTTDQASRYGGEEFTVILPSTKGEGGVLLAERIRTRFSEVGFFPSPNEEVHKTLSLGVTQYILGDDVESFVKRADANLYEAKHKGKDRTVLG